MNIIFYQTKINIKIFQNSNILLVTEAIENLSKSTLKDSEKNETNIFFNAENFPNPITQVLATSFRAIVEAYKISRQNNYPQ